MKGPAFALVGGFTLFAASLGCAQAAPDAVFLQAGRGDGTTSATAGIDWDFARTWRPGNVLIDGYWDLSVAHWRTDAESRSFSLSQVGITPVFRLRMSPDGVELPETLCRGLVYSNVLTVDRCLAEFRNAAEGEDAAMAYERLAL